MINGYGCLDMQEFEGRFALMVFRGEIVNLLLPTSTNYHYFFLSSKMIYSAFGVGMILPITF